jgi:hypothetical protein
VVHVPAAASLGERAEPFCPWKCEQGLRARGAASHGIPGSTRGGSSRARRTGSTCPYATRAGSTCANPTRDCPTAPARNGTTCPDAARAGSTAPARGGPTCPDASHTGSARRAPARNGSTGCRAAHASPCRTRATRTGTGYDAARAGSAANISSGSNRAVDCGIIRARTSVQRAASHACASLCGTTLLARRSSVARAGGAGAPGTASRKAEDQDHGTNASLR